MLLITNTSSSTSAQDQDPQFDAIAEEVQEIRGLHLERDVEEEFVTREQFQRRLSEDAMEDPATEAVRTTERVLVAFGLAPEGVNLLESEEQFVAQEVGGYYDTGTGKLYLIDTDRKRLSPLGESIYAHEVTHALQDQHFDLSRIEESLGNKNDDEAMAITALIEGDAASVEYEYVRSKRGLEERIEREQQKDAPNEGLLEEAPPIIVESFYFPYEAGEGFVAALYEEGGNKGVDAAFRDLPQSTEQVIHPEKYLERDKPTEIRLPDLSKALGAGWERLDENTFGEFRIIVLLAGQEPTDRGWEAALSKGEGWDGDRYALYAKGDEEAVHWRTVWDSPKDAREFAGALRAYDENRYDSIYVDRDGVLRLTTDERIALIEQDGTRVNYALAPGVEVATKVLGLGEPDRVKMPASLPNSGGGGMTGAHSKRSETSFNERQVEWKRVAEDVR